MLRPKPGFHTSFRAFVPLAIGLVFVALAFGTIAIFTLSPILSVVLLGAQQ